MKILYGVQGTGNGHISRSRMMAKAFAERGVEVTYLFSGRPKEKLFDMEIFGDYLWREGLTFHSEEGKVHYLKTAWRSKPRQFWRDIDQLDLTPYDLIISDFEPITAWAGRRAGKTVIGVGHQYAFGGNTPLAGDSPLSRTVMRHFAPVDIPLGLHWSRFNPDTLPPIIDTQHQRAAEVEDLIVAYLPFEDQSAITLLLQQIPHQQFVLYGPELERSIAGNVTLNPPSLEGFKHDLSRCRGVICNSGFELISECLHLDLPILTKPLQGQMEQHSNAAALQQLELACTTDTLDRATISQWLEQMPRAVQLHYPDVAKAVVDWIIAGQWQNRTDLSQQLWTIFSRNVLSRAA